MTINYLQEDDTSQSIVQEFELHSKGLKKFDFINDQLSFVNEPMLYGLVLSIHYRRRGEDIPVACGIIGE